MPDLISREFLFPFFNHASAQLAEKGEPETTTSLSELAIDLLVIALLRDPEFKAKAIQLAEVAAQEWLAGRDAQH